MADEESQPLQPPSGNIFLRVVWMGAIPAILLCFFVLADTAPWTATGYDFAVLLLMVTAVVARTIDVLRFGGTTIDGQPATPRHVASFAITLVLLTSAAWVLAHSIDV